MREKERRTYHDARAVQNKSTRKVSLNIDPKVFNEHKEKGDGEKKRMVPVVSKSRCGGE
jgi:hypothetical protein